MRGEALVVGAEGGVVAGGGEDDVRGRGGGDYGVVGAGEPLLRG